MSHPGRAGTGQIGAAIERQHRRPNGTRGASGVVVERRKVARAALDQRAAYGSSGSGQVDD